MRWLVVISLTAALSTVLGVATVNTWFRPDVSSSPEYREALEKRHDAEVRAATLERENYLLQRKLELNMLLRSQRDPINPNGVVVPAEERIPAPAVPYPTKPKNPNEKE